MLAAVGVTLIGLASVAAVYALLAAIWSIRTQDPRWRSGSYGGAYASAASLGLAVVLLVIGFSRDDFSIRYVAEHSSASLPLYLKVSALWAGQEGSMLLWAFLQALVPALVCRSSPDPDAPLTAWAMVVLSAVTTFFTAVTIFLSNPFSPSAVIPLDGVGLNPLLRHPGMVFHPPVLYLGFVGLAVPYAFAVAALMTGEFDGWPSRMRRWTLRAWLCLSIGILLGSRWAYDVLGWGGYWGWDPVENAALLPWLTTTALVHTLSRDGRGAAFQPSHGLLAVLSFGLVLFGSFATRSGFIQSVHAFARSNLGAVFLAAIALALALPLGLAIWRRSGLATDEAPERLLSRQGLLFLTLVVLLTVTASIFVGSLLPTITEAVSGPRLEAGAAWFDRVTGPQFVALLTLMALCSLVGQAATVLRRPRRAIWPAIAGAVVLPLSAYLIGFTRLDSLAAFAIVGLAGGAMLAQIVRHMLIALPPGRRSRLGLPWSIRVGAPRRLGGYLVHAGTLLIALGVIGTRTDSTEFDLALRSGQPAEVAGYTLLLEKVEAAVVDHRIVTEASLALYRDGAFLSDLRPAVSRYMDHAMTVTGPALRAGLREDLYVVLTSWQDADTATLKVLVNPLASFLWIGGLVMASGGYIALRQPARAPDCESRRLRWQARGRFLGSALAALLLVAAAFAMWGGAAARSSTRAAGRPLPGQPAPAFRLDLIDGGRLELSDLRGEVVVVTIWATWCPPCADELPGLEPVWEVYKSKGVHVVGVVHGDTAPAVADFASRYGLSFPIGLDVGDQIYDAYGLTGVPETFVIDRDGRVAYLHIGPVNPDQLAAELRRLVDAE